MKVVSTRLRPACGHEADLSRLGHDLRDPLSTVLGMAEILADGHLSVEQRDQVAMVQRAGSRMLVLVNELLELSLASGSAQDTAPGPRSLAGVRVLVVDDSEDARTLVEMYLARTGAQVTLAGTGEGALEAIAHQEFDVVLLDLHLPDGRGVDVVRTIRRDEGVRGASPLRIVALSADVQPSVISEALGAGCSAHLPKPVSRQALLQAVVSRPRASSPSPALQATFLSHRGVEIVAARAALRRGDFDHLVTVGHKLQGNGTSYGFPGLSRLGKRLEDAAIAGDARGVASLLTELASAVSVAATEDVPRAKPLSRTRIKVAARDGSHRGR